MENNIHNKIPEELVKAKQSLTQLKNLSLVMKLMLSTPENVMNNSHCTINDAIEKLEKAYDFTTKYALMYLQDAIKTISPIIEEKIYESVKNQN